MALPTNAHISTHPCVLAKLSQLRSANTPARDVKTLVHEIATLIGSEALAATLTTTVSGSDKSPLGESFDVYTTSPTKISLVPILRSGLAMTDALSALLPTPVPIHHLGMYRERTTLQPVEYYNNLPYHGTSTTGHAAADAGPSELAIVLDPVIATGATAHAAVETLREWGVKKVVVLSVLGSEEGVRRVAEAWEGVEVWVGGVDPGVNERGMIVPGLGDVGDRLFLTVGK
ncbi:PRTase-like protein [Trichodelitschia bisporula]|uniref:uracil phosphoribosyltransferase n=1 Tax=Trichodelitschia bisporula TaxID=703511 RepID=A0A6G1HLI1_9PEZI|nr:PRTase-like protein [Trichodelitschia bisporula]